MFDLEKTLRLVDPDPITDQITVLTLCQFMWGLPQDLQIKLLENNPVLTLEKMISFSENMWAIDWTMVSGPNVAAVSSPESLEIAKFMALVEQLAMIQHKVCTELSHIQHSANRWQPRGLCYLCGCHGHLARECHSGNCSPKCFTCNQHGHLVRDHTMDLNSS